MSFTIEKNRHIFACWAASRAAGVSPLCRFKVKLGKKILDEVFSNDGPKDKEVLKNSQDDFDNYHKEKLALYLVIFCESIEQLFLKLMQKMDSKNEKLPDHIFWMLPSFL